MNAATFDGPVVGVPSKGRLREQVLALLTAAGYPVGRLGSGSVAALDGIGLIEMRPRDAGAALEAGTLDAAFIATDIAMEHDLVGLDRLELGFARTDLVLASRDSDGRTSPADLAGCVVATHLPRITQAFFDARGIDVTVLAMGGSLEGVCASGLADALVDIRETGTSLRANRLRVLDELGACQAELVIASGSPVLDDLVLRLRAVLDARAARYVMLHIPPDAVDALSDVFGGLASPTVLPLSGRDDLVAAHLVVGAHELWARLSDLRAVGATGIVALEPSALLP